MNWTIDSIEENVASIELTDGKMIQLPVSLLPKGAKSGQMLRVTLEIDDAATKRAHRQSASQVKQISDESKKSDPGGDIAL